MSYTIIEIANTHGGKRDYLDRLIKTYEGYTGNYGMKFQPFSAETIATSDFPWYDVYTKLYFTAKEWEAIILNTGKSKDVWLDLFDAYGVQILKENLDYIYGLKLQVSVLFNEEVIEALAGIDLSAKKLILNVASLEMPTIMHFLEHIGAKLNAEEILLELGFQANPTELVDSGISKLDAIKSEFSNRIVFADHVNGEDPYAIWLPAFALLKGADVIEKHVMLAEETDYDFYSSLKPRQFAEMDAILKATVNLLDQPFINDKEREYLDKSLMKPILKTAKKGGEFIRAEDLTFRRSGQDGLSSLDIQNLQEDFHILSSDIEAGQTIKKSDFKKATIAIIVAGRLKSSRLKAKALKKIGDSSSVEFCLRSACRFENVNHVILATSDLESDAELEHHTYKPSVVFHKGDPDDVIQRYLDIVRKLKVDVVIRVTADMPFIDNEIGQILLQEHFKSGSDFTSGSKAAVGTNVEILTASALEEVKRHFPSANYSEYMTWYFMNNQDYFNIHLVDFPGDLVRDYRLTLDYQEDLEMFNRIHEELKAKGEYSIRDIFELLDTNPEIPEINGHLTLKYRTDQELIDTLNRVTRIGN
ncbi:N-acetylneuraminate synthase family protein [Akkermansiaceae bacterium]|nr:N-acetylneuraminate synthase family protein [Akkermansiaceae bacterium]MDB4513383.1 N-acetylneuraminate synthase family protein [Akkermansiaceae bacterium]